MVDTCGNSVHVELTGVQVHDYKMANALIKSTIKKETKAVVVDRGYYSGDIKECIFEYCAESVILVKSNSKSNNNTLNWYFYCCRHLVENAFARLLKHFRSIATRYNKLKDSYEAAVILVCFFIWLPLI